MNACALGAYSSFLDFNRKKNYTEFRARAIVLLFVRRRLPMP